VEKHFRHFPRQFAKLQHCLAFCCCSLLFPAFNSPPLFFRLAIFIPVRRGKNAKNGKVGAAAIASKSPALCQKGNAVWTHQRKNSRLTAFRFSISREKTLGTNFESCIALGCPLS